jgi:histidine ammonia-lyase
MTRMRTLSIDGHSLGLDDLSDFLAGGVRISASTDAMERVRHCAEFCAHLAAAETPHYGINTGFGKFARIHIAPEQAARLQHNLLRSHATASGTPLDRDTVRLMMVLRANSLLSGHSGASPELIGLILELVARDITPVVPCYGSVGASGDLAPLAHLSLALVGEGEVFHRGRRVAAREALAEEGLKPHSLRPKEGLALINGTQLMSAVAARELLRARTLLGTGMAAAAMSLEAFQATDRVFDARLHALKPHPGQTRVAEAFRRLHAGSAIIQSHRDCPRVQDPYSFRCIPQVLGAVDDMLSWCETWVVREINAVTDNPVVFPADGDVHLGRKLSRPAHGVRARCARDRLL